MNGPAYPPPASLPAQQVAYDPPIEKDGGFLSGVTDFEKYFDIARNNKVAIIAVLAVALALGLIATMLATPLYRSTTRIEISQEEQNVTNVEGVRDDRLRADRAFLPTQYELLESQSLASRVARELDLANDEAFLNAYQIQPVSGANLEPAITGVLLENIEIAPIINSTLVDISFSSPSPEVSAMVANGWADAFVTENLDRRFGATRDARDFLEERLQQYRDRLEVAERALIAYATEQGLVAVEMPREDGDSAGTASQTLVASELAAFSGALQEATAQRIAAEAALASRSGSNSASDADYGTGTAAQLRARRAELQVELANLRSQFSPSYPPVQALQAQIAELERVINQEQSSSQDRLRANYREALAREQRLQSQVNQVQSNYTDQRQDSVEYNILQREVETNREIYAGLLQRYREIGVVGVGESNINVVDAAQVPGAPYTPSLIRNLLISLVAGLVFVILGLYAYDFLNQTLRDPRQVRDRLGLNLLANIPRIPEGDIVEELQQSYSELYEAYFSLTSSIAFAAGGNVPRSLMITSSQPGEGKSLTAVAIAYLLARQGKKVLLVDVDLRKSGVGKYLSIDTPMGMSQYLLGNDDWQSLVIQSTPLEDFDVIPAGRKPLSAAELLSSGRFQRLLDEAAPLYDHVILDAPPVLGLADAPMIAPALDGVLLVIEANGGKWRHLESAVSRLRQANAELLGAAVTKLDERNAMYGYGSGYGYGYGYGGERKAESETVAPA
ncbi:polysaccharide biosynthesis tyrosine autokinase [Erythrobacter arachoides]|uniref:non-specific protein-tyrosine kinase n=1 Tax=Aurantiacibacter arachoides TaxID=1850444 RepID=A0A844ZZQ9_9SPHN|nr:polysaccharide biosynthesis tyrosine autokinase [Aurantiacibacter arachoides]MXO93385.1 polysaccharide biosynthesis tyrosine autokinase [Aurantiacibacter arachoides]GGD49766.1 hypothetical protein GCM10011411_06970 [Aurantiacibacter arachoides]